MKTLALFVLFACSFAHADFEKPVKWAVLAEIGNQRAVQILGRDPSGNYVVWTESAGAVTYQNRCGIEASYETQVSFAYPFLVSASTICKVNESEKAWVKVQSFSKADNSFSIAYIGSHSSAFQGAANPNGRSIQPQSSLAVQVPTLVFLYNSTPFPDENDEGGSLHAILIPLNASAKNPVARVKTILKNIPGFSGAIRLNREKKQVGITLADGKNLNELVMIDSKVIFQMIRENVSTLSWKSQTKPGIQFKGMSLSLDFTDVGFILGQVREKVVLDGFGKRLGSLAPTCTWLGVQGDSLFELCEGKKIQKSSVQARLGRPAPGALQ